VNFRTRLLVGALGLVPRPEPPGPGYLARVRRELPPVVARALLGRIAADVALTDLTIPVGGDVVLRARVYRRRDDDAVGPLVVNFHGGGFVYGNLTSGDWLCGNVAGRAGVTVVSVGYRLAPEHPAPIPYQDCWAATVWLVGRAGELGVDPTRVSLMGESAGGNLAALVALAGRDRARTDPDWPSFVGQILVYPATDLTLSSASVSELWNAPLLPRRTLDWYGRRYLPQGTPTSIAYDDPRVSPLHAGDHGDLAPALVIAAGLDPLRDDALRDADALTPARTPVRTVVYPEASHGFMSMPHFEPAPHAGRAEIVTELTAR
jgi:acetyl esterase